MYSLHVIQTFITLLGSHLARDQVFNMWIIQAFFSAFFRLDFVLLTSLGSVGANECQTKRVGEPHKVEFTPKKLNKQLYTQLGGGESWG